nr:MAG TPA: hypothetical protein [Caudoviricetes sp.]
MSYRLIGLRKWFKVLEIKGKLDNSELNKI